MPLQWLNLQQRQAQQQQRSPVSQALTPRQGAGVTMGAMPAGGGFMERQQKLEEKLAERKYEEKMMKLQHEQEMEKLKFAAGAKEDVEKRARNITLSDRQRDARVAQAQQQGAQRQQIESNPEPAAREMYELLKTLPDELQNVLLQQIFTPTAPSGTMTSAGRTVTTEPKYNPIADVFMSKGWATMGEGGKPALSEPVREFEKGTFKEMSDGSILNEATGEIIAKGSEIPTDWGIVYTETLTEGLKHIGEMMDTSWMQEMSTDEMKEHIVEKKAEYRNWVASRLYSKGMRDKAEINRLADLAVGTYDWQKAIDETQTPSPTTTTNRGLPSNEEVVTGLKQLFKENPDELNNLDAYRDEHGDASVDEALKEEVVAPAPIPTTPTTTLKKKKEEYDKYKAL